MSNYISVQFRVFFSQKRERKRPRPKTLAAVRTVQNPGDTATQILFFRTWWNLWDQNSRIIRCIITLNTFFFNITHFSPLTFFPFWHTWLIICSEPIFGKNEWSFQVFLLNLAIFLQFFYQFSTHFPTLPHFLNFHSFSLFSLFFPFSSNFSHFPLSFTIPLFPLFLFFQHFPFLLKSPLG